MLRHNSNNKLCVHKGKLAPSALHPQTPLTNEHTHTLSGSGRGQTPGSLAERRRGRMSGISRRNNDYRSVWFGLCFAKRFRLDCFFFLIYKSDLWMLVGYGWCGLRKTSGKGGGGESYRFGFDVAGVAPAVYGSFMGYSVECARGQFIRARNCFFLFDSRSYRRRRFF